MQMGYGAMVEQGHKRQWQKVQMGSRAVVEWARVVVEKKGRSQREDDTRVPLNNV
jgi:hypothetical protein